MKVEDKKALLSLARESIATYFKRKKPDLEKTSSLSEKRGIFVTLHKNGKLRGCVGFPMPHYPVNTGIVLAARSAAFHDTRFPILEEGELDKVEIEISVLTLPELIKVKSPEEYSERIKIGEDGLIMEGYLGSGLLLPQVATEYKMDWKEFLEALSQKSGLPSDAWKDLENKVYRFQAIVFSEKEFGRGK